MIQQRPKPLLEYQKHVVDVIGQTGGLCAKLLHYTEEESLAMQRECESVLSETYGLDWPEVRAEVAAVLRICLKHLEGK